MVLSEKNGASLVDAYQRRSDEIRERISAEFPEFSRISHKLDSCYYIYDKELAIVNRLLGEFDKMEVMEFIKESLDKIRLFGKLLLIKAMNLTKKPQNICLRSMNRCAICLLK